MTSIPESHHDLLDAQVAAFATIDGAGLPQMTAVWFFYDAASDRLKLSLNGSRKKTQNLRTRPGCSLFILDPQNQFRYLEVRGNATLEPDDDYAFAKIIGAKYDTDVSGYDAPGETRVVVTIEPLKVHAVDMSG